METYDDLVVKCQSGKIDNLDFLLSQEDLAILYIAEMQVEGMTPTSANALSWLIRYENNCLYQ